MSSSKRELLGGLGKATRRGVRKCPKCRTVNGTRGLSCKNKSCDFVFKEPIPDGKRLICPSVSPGSLYSLRHSSSSRAFIYRSKEGNTHCTECAYGPCKRLLPTSEQEALPLTLKVSVLNSLSIDDSLKHEIYSRAKEPGPLVQRVSRSWMVVKKSSSEEEEEEEQDTSSSSPVSFFPFVHIRFGVKFYHCSCCSLQKNSSSKCFHFLASLAVFAGDPVLAKEFARFTALLSQDDHPLPPPRGLPLPPTHSNNNSLQPSVLSIQDTNGETLQVSLVEEDSEEILLHKELDLLLEEEEQYTSSHSLQPLLLPGGGVEPPSKPQDLLPFNDWLASVNESINQGPLPSFSFQAPHVFFNTLRARISSVSQEPCSLSSGPRNCLKYSWKLQSASQLKEVFHNTLVPLDLLSMIPQEDSLPKQRSLLINNSNSYYYPHLKRPPSDPYSSCLTSTTTIEWTPDVLPISRVGELKISFETSSS